MGVTRRTRVLELRVVIDPVEAECLSSVLLVDQRDRLAVDSPIVALDDQILAGTVADELRAVARKPEFGGQCVAVVLPGEPVAASAKPRLEDPATAHKPDPHDIILTHPAWACRNAPAAACA